MRAWSLSVLMICLSLAGCAEEASDADAGGDEALQDLELQAGEDTGIIRGIVVDPSVTPVVGATITVQGTEQTTQSNDNGAFGFQGLQPGTYFLDVEKPGFATVQTSVEVQAGIDEPPVLKVLLEQVPGTEPFVQDQFIAGYLTCGAAIFVTSVGCTTCSCTSDLLGDKAIFSIDYDRVPQWIQGELVWDATQPAAGAFIWEIVRSEEPQTPQPHIGYRETTTSPALAYLNETVTQEHAEWIVEKGIDFRFFGGPHPMCDGIYGFGCGLTLEQETEIFLHNFYNFSPDEGWRFTADGAHPVPS